MTRFIGPRTYSSPGQKSALKRLSAPTRKCRLLAFAVAATGLAVQLVPAQESRTQDAPLSSPLLERAEVRFVTLDVIVEERGKRGWRPDRDLRKNQMVVAVGGRHMELEVFENWCRPEPAAPASETSTPDASSPPLNVADVRPEPASGGGPIPPTETTPLRYILYFDLTHLKVESFHLSLKAAKRWIQETILPGDEVMIVAGGTMLRIVRPLAPASSGILEDLQLMETIFQGTDMWAEWEGDSNFGRIREVLDTPGMAPIYAAMDFNRTKRSLQNLEVLMGLFDNVEGTKNLVFFQHTIRLLPGTEYPGVRDSSDVYMFLDRVARAANERNVKLYPVDGRGLARGPINDALTMLASETGGRWLTGTNDLGLVFDRVGADVSCFYRVGFRVPSSHEGDIRKILVRIEGKGRYRVRHRRTLRDTTREQEDMDRLRAAMLLPDTATAFPVTVTAMPLYRSKKRGRVRVQVSVARNKLLSLPAGEPGAEVRQVHIAMGGTVVPLDERASDTAQAAGWTWQGASEGREPWSFARQATVSLPASMESDDERDVEVLLTQEIDVPVGGYRLVAVVQDRLTRSVAADVIDFWIAPGQRALGVIGLMVLDPHAAIVTPEMPPGKRAVRRQTKKGRIIAVSPSLDARARTRSTLVVGEQGQLVYGLCDTSAEAADFDGWKLTRTLVCREGQLEVPMNGVLAPEPAPGARCVLVADALPGLIPPGECRYEVTLDRPGGERDVRRLSFRILPEATEP